MEQRVSTHQHERKKLLIGVFHTYKDARTCNEEINVVLDLMKQHRPDSMAIELPYDYKKREEYGMKVFFFGDLAERASINYNIKIQPLENPADWDMRYALDIARNVRNGVINPKLLIERMKSMKSFMEEETESVTMADRIIYKRYETGLSILDGMKKTRKKGKKPATIDCKIDESNRKREAHMVELINAEKPDFVVVGASHAFKLDKQLHHYLFINALREAERASYSIPIKEDTAAITQNV